MIQERNCEVCGSPMGYCTAKKKTCSNACKQKLYRSRKHEKLANQESTKESRTDNSNVHGEAQPQS